MEGGVFFAVFLSTAAVWCVPFCLDCSVPSVYSINYRRKKRDHVPRRTDQCDLHTHVIANKNKSPVEKRRRRVVARHVFILVFKEQMWSSPPTSRRNK